MEFEKCKKCPINGTCNLIKQGIEWQCTLNKEFAPKSSVMVHSTNLTFASDVDTDYTKYEGYQAED